MPGAKGEALEREFAAWMVSMLHYTAATQRELINGEVAKRPYEVDVHGERFSRLWYALHIIGGLLFILAVAAYLLPDELALVTGAVEGTVSTIWPRAAGSGILMLSIAAFVLAILGKKRATTHAWVECKNRKTSVKRADIEKLSGAVQDVRHNARAPWKPDEVIIVSAGGFDDDALSLADTYGFVCYQRSGKWFAPV
ncbi:hypothetical protein [Polyangium sp. 15x6]|uniref:hypothetical protein n=1 Tax=Polyangium sp. 15x6 TaxID=3042687 RepID=UPI00249B8BD3|nr:hypothetical protein [Polyangium sp. 15x6]MDI3287337.1 hypothetical protein [Polyangium sp. 15x6]